MKSDYHGLVEQSKKNQSVDENFDIMFAISLMVYSLLKKKAFTKDKASTSKVIWRHCRAWERVETVVYTWCFFHNSC
jgi:hypothetical protein